MIHSPSLSRGWVEWLRGIVDDNELDPEVVAFGIELYNAFSEQGGFEYEGEWYAFAPDFMDRMREIVNQQMEQAISDE